MNKAERLFLDIHAIQTLPPSNINRDDTGSPKTAQYGGVRRARVSSQSWKRAMRQYFLANCPQSEVGIRTLEIVKFVADKIQLLDSSVDDESALDMAESVITKAGIKTKDHRAKALVFLGNEQAIKLAEASLRGIEDKKELQNIIKNNPAVDIALFGRMVADDPSLNTDACAQVSHAISTHAIENEFDFFTAVDDLAPEDNAGAGMLGTIEFNSSTLYRYANVSVHDLLAQLHGDKEATVNTLKLFVKAFSNSLPTGKITTFANQTVPQLLVVALRSDRPVNLVNAFEEPIRSRTGYIEASEKALAQEFENVQKFLNAPLQSFYVSTGEIEFPSFGEHEKTLPSLVEEMAVSLDEIL